MPRRLARALWCLAFGILLAPLALSGAMVRIELPPETGSFKPGPGSEIANGQCLICHSVEYVTTQPPFPRAFWEATVKKMQEKYGAPLPESQVEPLVSYLTTHYGVATNAPAAPAASAVAAPSAAPMTGEAIATRYGCLGCHNVSVKVVGPAYKAIAAKYGHDPQAQAKISEQIHKGGSGKWGPIIMPPFPTVSGAETKALADWILGQK